MHRSRGAYTLMELIIVLAILVAVVSLGWPALRRLSYKARLQDAARQVRTALVRARLDAIESGRVHLFRYQPGSGRYEVASPDRETEAVDALAMIAPLDETHAAEGDDLLLGEQPSASAAEPIELGGGVVFLDPTMTEPQASAPMDAEPPGPQRWSAPIVFLPNGRTVNAHLVLANARYRVDVLLRGLTGTVKLGKVRREPVAEAALAGIPDVAPSEELSP